AGFFGVPGSVVHGVFRGLVELGLVEVFEAEVKGRGRRPKLYRLTSKGEELVRIEFHGERAGGPEHRRIIEGVVENLRLDLGVWAWVDTGEDVSAELPDIIVIPPNGYDRWGLDKILFVEVETRPSRDPGKVKKYIERAAKSRAGILFVVDEKYLDYIRGFGAEASTPDSIVDAVKSVLGL
ncbi:MAG: hypothetical protein GXO43_06290, partial [Crenarchaeota archaeon]|nr:hypothetical protein [Thermoproteota archaeon]